MLPIDSPCTKVCTLHPRVPICTGCGRNLTEIATWSSLSTPERLTLMDVVRERLAKLQARNWQPDEGD
jgi:predicted Fe-S protein YdhL (DUF1289 family)